MDVAENIWITFVRLFNITSDTNRKKFWCPSKETKFDKDFIGNELKSPFSVQLNMASGVYKHGL